MYVCMYVCMRVHVLEAGEIFDHSAHEAHLHAVLHAVEGVSVSPPIEAADDRGCICMLISGGPIGYCYIMYVCMYVCMYVYIYIV